MRKYKLSLLVVAFGLSFAGTACGKKDPGPAPAATKAPESGEHAGHGEHVDPPGAPPHTHEHGQGEHTHKSPHGGQVVSAGKYHLEAVASKVGLMVFLLDENEAELPVDKVKGKVLLAIKDGSAPTESSFESMGNHLHAIVKLPGPWTAVVTLEVDGATLTGRFEGNGVDAAPPGRDHGAGDHDHGEGGHDHGEAGHDHGGGDHAAMPQMKLSDTVESKVAAAAPIEAGKPATLSFAYTKKGETAGLADFEVVHEKKLHVFVVSDDLAFFEHVHPSPADAAAGTWTLTQTFPHPGKYHVYSDFKSTGAGANVTVSDIDVPGTAPAPVPLVVDTQMSKTFGDLTFALALTPSPLTQGDAILAYTVTDAAGQPVTDLQPYLGAFGHLFILKEDKVTMAHAHPQGAEPTPDMRGGPTVKFHTQVPSAGRYKLWAQFQRGDKVITTEWTVEAR